MLRRIMTVLAATVIAVPLALGGTARAVGEGYVVGNAIGSYEFIGTSYDGLLLEGDLVGSVGSDTADSYQASCSLSFEVAWSEPSPQTSALSGDCGLFSTISKQGYSLAIAGTVTWVGDTGTSNPGPDGVLTMSGTASGDVTGPFNAVCTASSATCVISVGSLLPTASRGDSSTCQFNGGQQVADTTVEGVRTFVYVWRPSPTTAAVCFRAQDSAGAGAGGMVLVTPSVPGATVGVPSSDADGSACASTTPNAVPGAHPMATGGVAGQPFAFDTYSNGTSAAWVCVQVGSTVDTRVMLPVSARVGSPGNEVSFFPDPGTP